MFGECITSFRINFFYLNIEFFFYFFLTSVKVGRLGRRKNMQIGIL